MMTATNTRKEARESLSGKWGKGALITLCYWLILFAINLVSRIIPFAGLGSIVINVPISYGIIVAFMKLKRGENVGAFDFLTLGFSNFGRAWSVCLRTMLKLIVPIILMIVLLIVTSVGLSISLLSSDLVSNTTLKTQAATNLDLAELEYDLEPSYSNRLKLSQAQKAYDDLELPSSTSESSSLPILLIIIGLIAYFVILIYTFIRSLLYVLSNNIAYDEPNLSAKEAVEKSQTLMKGNRGNYFVLSLSFIGWAILASFTFGIGLLWLFPYVTVSIVCFYEELSNKNNVIENEVN